jgi:hypothetical protein
MLQSFFFLLGLNNVALPQILQILSTQMVRGQAVLNLRLNLKKTLEKAENA